MDLIINDYNLDLHKIDVFNTKVRALLIDDDNNILLANYGSVYLLPGGKIDGGEDATSAIIRELKEETGSEYLIDELEYLVTLDYYQKDYPIRRNNGIINRFTKTYYYVGKYKGILVNNQKLSEREKKDNFKLELVSLDNIEEIILNNKTNNPRNVFFIKELLTIIDYYKQNKKESFTKIIK